MARKKVFLCFDYHNDQSYNSLMKAWEADPDFEFIFTDLSSEEININSVTAVKQVISRKINEAKYTVVLVGKEANKQDKDHKEIGYTNWLNYEIAKTRQHKKKLIGVKLDNSYESPDELLNPDVIWVIKFGRDEILKALNEA